MRDRMRGGASNARFRSAPGTEPATEWGSELRGGPGTPARALTTLVGRGLPAVAGRAGRAARWTGPTALIVYDAEARETMEPARRAVAAPAAPRSRRPSRPPVAPG